MQLHQEIVDTIPMFFFIWDTDKQETIFISERFYNERSGEYHNPVEPKEDLRQYLSPKSQREYDDFFAGLSSKNNYLGEIELEAADNLDNIRWVMLKTYPVQENKHVKRIIGHIRDITYEKESYQLLNERLKSLDVVAFMLAHELSAPISNIMGLADFLQQQVAEGDTEDYLYLFDKIFNYGGEVLTLARGMVSLINLQGLKDERVKKKKIQFRDFLEKEVKDFYFRDKRKKIRLADNIQDDDVVFADRAKFKWAIGELLLYLVKKSKGTADVIVSMPEKGSSQLDTICVYSEGLNLPTTEIRRLLSLPTDLKLSDVQGRKISGMLELIIAKDIIQLHEGKLDIYETDQYEGIKIILPAIP